MRFCYVSYYGSYSSNYATYSDGVFPAFCF